MHLSQSKLKVQLSIFMFLQYFIWGAWYMSLGVYLATQLKFTGGQIGVAYGAFAIGSMISPFFVGLVADRYFASERILGVLGLAGGLAMFALAQTASFSGFYTTLIVYCALFAPTLALGNSLSLHHLADSPKDFPQVKIFAAIGWIVGLVALSLLQGEGSVTQFYLAGVASLVFGLFSFTLPHTPPHKVGKNVSIGEVLGFDALALLKKPSFAIFVMCLFLICIPLYFYFVMLLMYLNELQWEGTAWKSSLAQVSDVVFLFLLATLLKRLGYKKTIFLGMLAWVVRYFLLAQSVNAGQSQLTLIFAAILMHGVCYDFLFIAGQLYADSESNEKIRGAVQGFLAFVLWGVGAFVGSLLAGMVLEDHLLVEPRGTIIHDWQSIWRIPAWGAVAVLVVFLIFFRDPPVVAASDSEEAASLEPLV